MANVPSLSPSVPVAVRLHIPAADRFRAIATALAGKFAEMAGGTADDARGLGQAFDRAATDVLARRRGAETAGLDIEYSRGGGKITIDVRCAGERTQVARQLP